MNYSVLMTVYDKDNPLYFKTALKSMINQTKIPDEIVIVKDGPVNSNIQSVINDIKNESSILIKEIQLEKNKGLGLALNEGIKYCRNELIARMDSDDISLPTRCEKQVIEFEKDSELDIIGCPVIEFIGEINNKVGERKVPLDNNSIYRYCKKRDPFNHPTVMYKKSKLEAVGCYSDLRKNQDTDLWIKMLSNNAKCLNLPDVLLYFRFDEKTYKKRKNWLNTKLLIKIRWKAYLNRFCSFFDFFQVLVAQLIIFIMPMKIQKFIYKNLLRR